MGNSTGEFTDTPIELSETITGELSRVVEIACEIIDALNQHTYEGNLSVGEGITPSATEAEAYFTLDPSLETEQLNDLKVFLAPISEAYGYTKRNDLQSCMEFRDELVICIARKFKPTDLQEINDLMFLKEEITELMAVHFLEREEDFVGFSGERASTVDRGFAAKKKFVSYVPLTFDCNVRLRPEDDQPIE